MRSIAKVGILLALTGIMLTSCMGGYYYVNARPNEPYYVRPVAPFGGAVWIDGEWEWTNGRYAFIGGHWERSRPGHVWIRGAWRSGPRGYAWHRGYWR
jgi:hypothetical protein